ncbi:MAG: RNA polymerase sigma factor [Acidobacteriota bacterium]
MINPTLASDHSSVKVIPFVAEHKPGAISFEELYKLYYKRVYSLCLRMMANPADAEDLAHDTILQVQHSLNSYRGDATFSSWLHRITVNQVLMYFRKKSTRVERVTDTGEMPDQVEPLTDRVHSLPSIDHIALAAAIEKLPPGYRSVFLLYDVEGYEHDEVGQILGVSSGTSKSQLHKARMRLREILMSDSKYHNNN